MKNGWTGGQYSLYRAIFGLYLFIHFLFLLPWAREIFSNRGALPDARLSPLTYAFANLLAVVDFPAFVQGFILLGAILSLFFLIGKWDKVAAIGIWYIWACLLGRNPLISNPSIPFIGWLLLAHQVVPGAPYGSRAAAERVDPSEWKLPPMIFLFAWIIMAAGYSYSGYTKLLSPSWTDGTALMRVLQNPLARPGFVHDFLLTFPPVCLKLATWGALALELLFAPLALFRVTRPWIWLAMTILHLGLVLMINFADLTAGMLLLHFFTFDPAWVPPIKVTGTARIFYDGQCGLCHRTVRFVLAEDRTGTTFRFAPLQSDVCQNVLSKEEHADVPDSVVVATADGKLQFRSAAILYIFKRLGGVWRIVAIIVELIPSILRDAVYDFIGRIRYQLFRRPTDACPVIAPSLRDRFDF